MPNVTINIVAKEEHLFLLHAILRSKVRMKRNTEAIWSRFCGRLISYINEYYCSFVKMDYEMELRLTQEEIFDEITSAQKISDLSPELQKVALQLKSTDKEYWKEVV